jgi:hypothetical protein
MEKFEWQIETKIGFRPLLMLYRALFKPKGYKQLTTHAIEFNSTDGFLYYRVEELGSGWAVKPEDVACLAMESALGNSSQSRDYTGYLAELRTKNNDQHRFQCDLSEAEFQRMEREILALR